MTSKVTIESFATANEDIFVAVVNPLTREIVDSRRLAAGEKASFWVHKELGLTVSEVSKISREERTA